MDVTSVALSDRKSNCVWRTSSVSLGHYRLFINLFIHEFIHSFIRSCIHSFIHSFIRPCIHSFIHVFIHLFVCLFIYSFIYLYLRSKYYIQVLSFLAEVLSPGQTALRTQANTGKVFNLVQVGYRLTTYLAGVESTFLLNLIKLKFSPNSTQVFYRLATSANSSQLVLLLLGDCVVVGRQLNGFLASWLDLTVTFRHQPF